MKINKKLISLMAVVALGGLVVGCSSKADANEGDQTLTYESQSDNKEQAPTEEEEQEEVLENEEEQGNVTEEESEPVAIPETKPEEVPVEKPQAQTKPEQTPAAKPEVKPDTTPAVKPETKPETKPEQVPAEKPEAKPDTAPEVKPEETPEVKPEVKPEETTLSSSEVVAKIVEGIELPAAMTMDEQMLLDVYGIDASLLESFQVKMPMMVVHASEIAVFKLKDTNDAQKVLDGINTRYESLYNTWSIYLPDQFELVQNYKVAQKDEYILFAISEAVDTIVTNFNSLIK